MKDHPLKYLLASPVLFGLSKQGHIPTIEKMLADGKPWTEIGKAIGWDPETAERHYKWHLEGKARGDW